MTSPLTWIEVDLAAIQQNVRNLKSLLKPETRFLAVIKANAYGHGLMPVARAVVAAGADWLGVNSAEEAIALRETGIMAPILVLGVVPPEIVPRLAGQTVSIVVSSLAWWQDTEPIIAKLRFPLGIHVKVEAGTNRLGMEAHELLDLANQIRQYPKAIWQGTYAHFAAVEDAGYERFTRRQAERFHAAIKQLKTAGGQPGIRHMAATAATLIYPEYHFDMVRCGIGIYGLWPGGTIWQDFARRMKNWQAPQRLLTPALAWKTRIVQVKDIPRGESIGYGRTYRVKRPMRVAVLPIGYSDGFDRGLSNRGAVIIHDRVYRVAGRVAMNMTMIDITQPQADHVWEKSIEKPISLGNEVTLIQGVGDKVPVDSMSSLAQTINYEIVSRLPVHIPRIYRGG